MATSVLALTLTSETGRSEYTPGEFTGQVFRVTVKLGDHTIKVEEFTDSESARGTAHFAYTEAAALRRVEQVFASRFIELIDYGMVTE